MGYRKQNPVTVDGVLYADANKVTSSTTAGTAGQILTSNGPGVAPTYQASSASGAVTQLNGDTGSATPAAGIITLNANTNSGSTVKFTGTGSTVSLKVTDSSSARNTFIGLSAGNAAITTGNNNTSLGYLTMQSVTSSPSNTAIGEIALNAIATGTGQNTALGQAAMSGLTTGANNVAIGSGAGSNFNGAESNNIMISNLGTAGDSAKTMIGTQGTQTTCFIAGVSGVSVANLNLVTINTSTGQMGSAASTSIIPTGATGTVLQGQGAGVLPAYSTATYPSIATGTGTILRADGTNWVATTATYPTTTTANQLLYSSATNTVGGLSTANSGVLTTNSSGVPSIDTTNFAVLSTGVQMKGNNTNTAPPAGFIGEHIRDVSGTVPLTTSTGTNIASVSLTAGIWDVSAMCLIGFSGVATTALAGISTTSATITGTIGQEQSQFFGALTASGVTITIPKVRATLNSTTTYYLVATGIFSTGAGNALGGIQATRVG